MKTRLAKLFISGSIAVYYLKANSAKGWPVYHFLKYCIKNNDVDEMEDLGCYLKQSFWKMFMKILNDFYLNNFWEASLWKIWMKSDSQLGSWFVFMNLFYPESLFFMSIQLFTVNHFRGMAHPWTMTQRKKQKNFLSFLLHFIFPILNLIWFKFKLSK